MSEANSHSEFKSPLDEAWPITVSEDTVANGALEQSGADVVEASGETQAEFVPAVEFIAKLADAISNSDRDPREVFSDLTLAFTQTFHEGMSKEDIHRVVSASEAMRRQTRH